MLSSRASLLHCHVQSYALGCVAAVWGGYFSSVSAGSRTCKDKTPSAAPLELARQRALSAGVALSNQRRAWGRLRELVTLLL